MKKKNKRESEMPFAESTKQTVPRTVMLSLLILTALGALVADRVTKQRDVSAKLTVEMLQKGEQGRWDVVDRMSASANFTASVRDLAAGKEARTDFTWRGTSEKGRTLAVRWAGPAKLTFDSTTGVVEAAVTFEATIDGKRVRLPSKFSTESTPSPIGELHGQRGTLANGTFSASLVGTAVIRERDLLDNSAVEGQGKLRERKGTTDRPGRAGGPDELIVVIKASGRTVVNSQTNP